MPCGCFGGGNKKKGSRAGSEGPPKLPPEEPIKLQVSPQPEVAVTTTLQTSSRPENGATPSSGNGPITGNGTVNSTPSDVVTTTTPQAAPTTEVVDGSKSSGARSRAELYAKRREFFRPLYDVSLTTANNQRFATPRSSNTLPARGKRGGAFLAGVDGSGYFTVDGRYVAGEPPTTGTSFEDVLRNDGSGAPDAGNVVVVDGQYVDSEGRATDRPPRPTSQPSALAGEWDEILDSEHNQPPQDEFHQKHQQIIQHQQQHSPNVPQAPPPPKEVNPHFIEFQQKHYKILNEPESHHRSHDPELTQKLAENRLTELDKLHNEVQQHYEKRIKHGPVDVDSLVEKYTEERWRKMVEVWEAEGLVVEGGMVVIDEKGNAMGNEIEPNDEGGRSVVQKVSHTVESVGSGGETVIERIERDGDKVITVVETTREVIDDGRRGVIKHTEEIMVEKVVEHSPSPTVTTIVTPPTPQIEITSSDVTPLAAELNEDQLAEYERDMNMGEYEQYGNEQNSNYVDLIERQDQTAVHDLIERQDQTAVHVEYVQEDDTIEPENEPLVELETDENFKNQQQPVELERLLEAEELKSGISAEDLPLLEDPSTYRVSPPPSPPAAAHTPLQTCTPPPSPQQQRTRGLDEDDNALEVSAVLRDDRKDIVPPNMKASATPPPSPPLQAAADQQS